MNTSFLSWGALPRNILGFACVLLICAWVVGPAAARVVNRSPAYEPEIAKDCRKNNGYTRTSLSEFVRQYQTDLCVIMHIVYDGQSGDRTQMVAKMLTRPGWFAHRAQSAPGSPIRPYLVTMDQATHRAFQTKKRGELVRVYGHVHWYKGGWASFTPPIRILMVHRVDGVAGTPSRVSPRPPRTNVKPRPARSTRKPSALRKPRPKPRPVSTRPKPTARTGKVWAHLHSYPDKSERAARRELERLKRYQGRFPNQQIRSDREYVSVKGRYYYRIRIGPFQDRKAVEEACRSKIKAVLKLTHCKPTNGPS